MNFTCGYIVWGILIPKGAIENECPDQTDRAEQSECIPPRKPGHDPNDQQGCERATPAGAQPQDDLRARALVVGQPDHESLGQIWKAARLAHAEAKSRDDQGGEIP